MDIFDVVLDLESAAFDQGKDEGFAEGLVEGREIGFEAGHEVGKELGYYLGCLEFWLIVSKKFPDKLTPRNLKTVTSLRSQITSLVIDPEQPFMYAVESIRGKFNVLCTQLRVVNEMAAATAIADQADLSFYFAPHALYIEGENSLSGTPFRDNDAQDQKCPRRIIRMKNSLFFGIDGTSQSVTLSHRDLTSIPRDIVQFSLLQTLDLSENSLDTLPDSLAILSHLSLLNLSKNKFTVIPRVVEQCTHLTHVSLEMNFISTVTDAFCSLPTLQQVKLSYNHLTEFPIIPSVEELYLASNQLSVIPESITTMKKLRILALEHNVGLPQALPAFVGNMSSLKVIRIGGTNIKQNAVPEDIKAAGTKAIHNYFKSVSRLKLEEGDNAREKRPVPSKNDILFSRHTSMKTYNDLQSAWTEKLFERSESSEYSLSTEYGRVSPRRLPPQLSPRKPPSMSVSSILENSQENQEPENREPSAPQDPPKTRENANVRGKDVATPTPKSPSVSLTSPAISNNSNSPLPLSGPIITSPSETELLITSTTSLTTIITKKLTLDPPNPLGPPQAAVLNPTPDSEPPPLSATTTFTTTTTTTLITTSPNNTRVTSNSSASPPASTRSQGSSFEAPTSLSVQHSSLSATTEETTTSGTLRSHSSSKKERHHLPKKTRSLASSEGFYAAGLATGESSTELPQRHKSDRTHRRPRAAPENGGKGGKFSGALSEDNSRGHARERGERKIRVHHHTSHVGSKHSAETPNITSSRPHTPHLGTSPRTPKNTPRTTPQTTSRSPERGGKAGKGKGKGKGKEKEEEASDDFYLLSSDSKRKFISLQMANNSWLGEAANASGNVLIKETNFWKVLKGSGRVNWFDLYSQKSLSIMETNNFQDYEQYFFSNQHLNFAGLWKVDDVTIYPFTLSVMSTPEADKGYRALLRTPHGDQRIFLDLKKLPKPNLNFRKNLETHVPWIKRSKLSFIKIPGSENVLLELERDKFVGIIYCDNSDASEKELLTNSKGSKEFDEFLSFLGKKVKLEGWDKFNGGLDTRGNSTGTHSIYTTYSGIEVMFHVSTLINTPNNKNRYLTRKVHVGNDVVVIIWLEDTKPFDPVTISSKFNHVYFVIQPVASKDKEDKRKWVRVTIATKKDVTTKDPILPAGTVYEQNNLFRDLLLSQLINSEKSAYTSPGFSNMTQTMRQQHLATIYHNWSGVMKDSI